MSHAKLLIAVVILAVFGLAVCGIDVYRHGQLHMMNAVVGGGSLVLALALALPVQMDKALDILAPYLDRFRPGSK